MISLAINTLMRVGESGPFLSLYSMDRLIWTYAIKVRRKNRDSQKDYQLSKMMVRKLFFLILIE